MATCRWGASAGSVSSGRGAMSGASRRVVVLGDGGCGKLGVSAADGVFAAQRLRRYAPDADTYAEGQVDPCAFLGTHVSSGTSSLPASPQPSPRGTVASARSIF